MDADQLFVAKAIADFISKPLVQFRKPVASGDLVDPLARRHRLVESLQKRLVFGTKVILQVAQQCVGEWPPSTVSRSRAKAQLAKDPRETTPRFHTNRSNAIP